MSQAAPCCCLILVVGLVDLMLQETLGDVETLLHHTVVSCGFVVGVYYGIATFYMQALLVAELSTPFINARSVPS